MSDYYDLGTYSRAVTTGSPLAQRWFDRGLAWTYGYNHDEAIACFRKALEADPGCAMAWWGIAYAAGPNYNKPWEAFDEEDARRSLETAFQAVGRAEDLCGAATDTEKALMGAMLPVGGPKGIGLAMMIECLAASLSGTFAPTMRGVAPAIGSATMHVGAFFFVVNPERIVGRETFERHVEGWVSQYLTATGADGRLPGQRAADTERERTANGIPIPPEIIAELREAGEKVGEPFDVRLS